VLQQGSSIWVEREKATAQLKKLPPSASSVLKWATKHKDPEIAARSHKLWQEHCWGRAQVLMPTRWPYVPWIDSLPYTAEGRYAIINSYLDLAGWEAGAGATGAPLWEKYRKATKIYIFHLLVRGSSEEYVITLLDDMAQYEKGWVLKNRHSYSFPKEILAAAEK
jgi:hypothetical protein